jgi:3-oxoacyl-[acyl-carrier protein] reductase
MTTVTGFTDKTVVFAGFTQTVLAQAMIRHFAEEGAITLDVAMQSGVNDVRADVLVLLAPEPSEAPFSALNDNAWLRAVNDTLVPFMRLIREYGEGMTARRQGCIIVVGSLSGTLGWPGYTVSSTVDGAIIALVRSLACEWAVHNVRLVYLAYAPSGADEMQQAQFAARTPLGNSTTPVQIARVARFLASDNASFVTGSVIRADGGWSAWGLLK